MNGDAAVLVLIDRPVKAPLSIDRVIAAAALEVFWLIGAVAAGQHVGKVGTENPIHECESVGADAGNIARVGSVGLAS